MASADRDPHAALAGEMRDLQEFAADVHHLVQSISDESDLTKMIDDRLRVLLADGLELPDRYTRAHPERYVMYPLYVADDGSFSIASAVWNVGQSTPVHGHETWGVVGIHKGIEQEVRYAKPTVADEPLNRLDQQDWGPGDVTVCCTTDDDVHQVSCGGPEPCVGIHVYGADIGTLPRRSYIPESGKVSWFVSSWAEPIEK